MKRRFGIFLLAACLFAGVALAETVYVTDKLRLGVHAKADTSDRAFTNLDSGDALEILERRGSYARVRLEDGREGYVRTVFLVSEEPARRRMLKLEAERDALARKLTELAASGEKISQAQSEAASARQALRSAESQLAMAQRESEELRDQLSPDRLTMTLFVGLAAGLGLLLLGFLLAWWWFDRRSRRRHGGLRVY